MPLTLALAQSSLALLATGNISDVSTLVTALGGPGGIIAICAMPAIAVIGLALINARSQAQLVRVLENNTAAALQTAKASADLAAAVNDVHEGQRETNAKLGSLDKTLVDLKARVETMRGR